MLSKLRILVTGSSGQLGSELKELAEVHSEYEFIFLTRRELPLNDTLLLRNSVTELRPDYLINCAAYTAVDKAESERDQAFLVNAQAVGVLAQTCAEIGSKFIHISTDYVFAGTSKSPLNEESTVQPINVYGESKLEGEKEAMNNNPDAIIIRTSWVYSFYGKNFVKTMIRLMNEKERISVVNDQWGSPTYAADLAQAIMQIIQLSHWQPGIYHYSNEGVITWFDFAKEIGDLLHTKCTIQSTTTANFPTPARRPLYSVMDKTKIQKKYGVQIKPWKESLQKCILKLRERTSAQ